MVIGGGHTQYVKKRTWVTESVLLFWYQARYHIIEHTILSSSLVFPFVVVVYYPTTTEPDNSSFIKASSTLAVAEGRGDSIYYRSYPSLVFSSSLFGISIACLMVVQVSTVAVIPSIYLFIMIRVGIDPP